MNSQTDSHEKKPKKKKEKKELTNKRIESKKQKQAFEMYYRMPVRSMEKTGKKIGVCTETICAWSHAFDWEDRIKERNQIEWKKTTEKLTDYRAEMNLRHLKNAQILQEKGIEAMMAKPIGVREAVKAVKSGIILERLVTGESTERTETQGEVNFSDIKKIFEEVHKKSKDEDDDEPESMVEIVREAPKKRSRVERYFEKSA